MKLKNFLKENFCWVYPPNKTKYAREKKNEAHQTRQRGMKRKERDGNRIGRMNQTFFLSLYMNT